MKFFSQSGGLWACSTAQYILDRKLFAGAGAKKGRS
jgi:hypothetical protein